MKVSFPHMGNQLFYKKLMELFEIEYIVPFVPTKRTIDSGVKNSPEFACFPYKVLLGTYIEAIEAGADTIITSGGSGPCRAGLYAQLHEKTLKSMGYDVNFIVFDDFGRDKKQFIDNLKKIKGKKSWLEAAKIFYTAYKIADCVDNLQKIVEIRRAYELEHGSFNNVFKEIMKDIDDNVHSLKDIKPAYKRSEEILNNIPLKKSEDKIKVGIVGEIYVVMEPSVNMNIVEVLNSLGCEVSNSMFISEWIRHNTLPACFKNLSGHNLLDLAKKYLKIQIGGHESHNIGNMLEYKKQGYDGVIHLMPFGCLPELVTQTLAPEISRDNDLPILTLSLDEQTGIANNMTRIEAFVDLLRKNKEKING